MTNSSPPDGQVAASTVPLEFKGTTLSVTAIVISDADPAKLHQLLLRKLAEAPGFFEGELAMLDLTRLSPQAAGSIDLVSLIAPLRQAGMIPVAARGLTPSLAKTAEALGLAVLAATPARRGRPDASGDPTGGPRAGAAASQAPARPATGPVIARPAAPRVATPASGPRGAAPMPATSVGAVAAGAAPAAAPAPAPTAVAPAASGQRSSSAPAERRDAAGNATDDTITALVVERPLRSGQRIYARGRDLVLLAGISPGAEVIADGSIHCYGPLRGRALAGASGDATARIFATDFQAELVSIAGVYRTFELTDEKVRGGQPVRISLRNDVTSQAIAIEPISGD